MNCLSGACPDISGAAQLQVEATVFRAKGPNVSCCVAFRLGAQTRGGAPALAWQGFAVYRQTLIGLELSGCMSAWDLIDGLQLWTIETFLVRLSGLNGKSEPYMCM